MDDLEKAIRCLMYSDNEVVTRSELVPLLLELFRRIDDLEIEIKELNHGI